MTWPIRRVLSNADDKPERLLDEPLAWVHINEVPKGNWGAVGKVADCLV
jgi:hypothetical protein